MSGLSGQQVYGRNILEEIVSQKQKISELQWSNEVLLESLEQIASRIEAGDLDEWSLKALAGKARAAQTKAVGGGP